MCETAHLSVTGHSWHVTDVHDVAVVTTAAALVWRVVVAVTPPQAPPPAARVGVESAVLVTPPSSSVVGATPPCGMSAACALVRDGLPGVETPDVCVGTDVPCIALAERFPDGRPTSNTVFSTGVLPLLSA